MDTKLKNRVAVSAWLFLFTFGLSGTLPFLFHSYYPDQTLMYAYITCGLSALFVSLFWLKKISIYESLEYETYAQYYNRLPIDVSIVIALFFGLCTLIQVRNVGPTFSYDVLQYLRRLFICTVLVALTMMQGQFIIQRFRDKDQWKMAWEYSVIHRTNTAIRDAFLSRSTGAQVMLLLGIIYASGFGIMVVCIQPKAILLYVPLFVMVTIPALVITFGRVGYFNRIVETTNRLAAGYAEPDLPIKGNSVLAKLAENVNALKHGVETSLASQAKSERLKTDLITNVSHDLRTPLTSIITYTELLKTPELSAENRDAYIEILDQKSKRLKVLIDDLFEASIMASGSIQLVREQVDIAQLLQQALAENNELIDQSTLQFRVTTPDVPIYCVVDGQKLWRVFDNLIRNILKYSLEHTRVHISITTSDDNVLLTFKNITKYELSENIDELFERFKRGDTSRHTDGSGLGLAIAKSIVDLHGGRLDLGVDGDLFKATVTLKCVR
ncbi:sensor histidine kinase [Alicyclobacillus dauci]|uniref:histidine kinase n=1 Tax=Alicyclobacillus dauci TaxID=1475485 RepID=A0ABY6Z4E4_9BACL|nr:HAMP domain-containing sensor histidine kinase [Alicyclobacillus dauci]WAH37537.1 HAMP domain-containing histidine kinase [Alicyclobacillus dauci]